LHTSEHEPVAARNYLIVSADQPFVAAAAIQHSPTPPDLCVKSPSPAAGLTADLVFDGRHVRTIDEPLLEGRRPDESEADFEWRCADALRALYALETQLAFVIFDALPSALDNGLLLDESSILELAERIERTVPPP
jgi:hypothetical protein